MRIQAGPAFAVNSSADTDDGICGILPDNNCTLREAINAANAISGADTITFDASLNGTPITLVDSQLPVVTSEITITGNGAANTIIQASACNPTAVPSLGCTHDYSVFEVTSAGNLTIDSLTVRHGNSPEYGGGIYNSGGLTVTNSALSENASYISGGGIYNSGGLTVTNSTLSENISHTSGGGGIINYGTTSVTNSTFSGNSADYGGGIYNNGTLLEIQNSTFSGNSAHINGGGIRHFVGQATLINVTLSNNLADTDNDSYGDGGGVAVYPGATLTLANTIIAGNDDLSTSGYDDCAGALTSQGYNLVGDGTGCSISSAGDLTTSDPLLGALADNGGPTQTFALLPGSAAIDAGDDTVCDDDPGPNNLDQRGVSRVGNGDHCDIGAYESRGFTLTKTGGDNQSAIINTAFTDPLSVMLNETGGSVLPGATITFTAPSSGASITSMNETALTDTSGIASISATANGIAGSYNVTASAAGVSVDFTLSNTYTLTYTAGANGSITGDSPQTVISGADGTAVTAVANPGYHFVDWSDGVLTASRTDTNVLADISVTANFAINTTVTFYSSGSYDGWILETGEKTSKGGMLNAAAPTFRLGDDAAKKQYRGILSFKTSSLSDTAVIVKVTLNLRKQGIIGGGNPVTTFKGFMADIKKGYIGTSASLQAADFQTAASKTYGPFKTALSGVWYNIDLTSGKSYINKLSTSSGLTQIRLRFYLDDNNNTTANYLSLYSGNADTSYRPQLVIEYYVAP